MPLKISQGNMYTFVTDVHTHLGGECPHKCKYCYVGLNRWGRAPRYTGDLRLLEHELRVDYGSGKTIFIEHMNDMFAEGVKGEWIEQILSHCRDYPANEYVFQTKNPARVLDFLNEIPEKTLLGTTIETNRSIPTEISQAPATIKRVDRMIDLKKMGLKTFVTIEPIMDFDVESLAEWLKLINPEFVNIGADSKNCKLPEPSGEKVMQLVEALGRANITIKKKFNLDRLLKKG